MYLYWPCNPAYCTSWVFLVWKSSHRGCLALQPNPAHLHSLLHVADDPHRNSQSTTKSHTNTHTQGDNLVSDYYNCQPNYFLWNRNVVLNHQNHQISIMCDWPPPSPRPSIGYRASDCTALCCLASAWCYSDEAQGSTPAAPACLHHSCQSTEEKKGGFKGGICFSLRTE